MMPKPKRRPSTYFMSDPWICSFISLVHMGFSAQSKQNLPSYPLVVSPDDVTFTNGTYASSTVTENYIGMFAD